MQPTRFCRRTDLPSLDTAHECLTKHKATLQEATPKPSEAVRIKIKTNRLISTLLSRLKQNAAADDVKIMPIIQTADKLDVKNAGHAQLLTVASSLQMML